MQIGKLRKMFLQGIMLASVLSLIILLPSHNAKAAPSQATATISIPATQSWTDTGIDLTQGSSVSIIASGTIYIAGSDPGKTPDGDPTCAAGSDYVAPGLHCWSLIGNIANGIPFEVGSSAGFSASAAGRLYLGVNDNVFGDNSGSWTAMVTVTVPLSTIDLQTLDIHSLQPLVAGTNPTFRADIRNNGSIASGNFNIQWIADGTIFDGGHYSIPAGVTDTHDHIWSNITPGNHTLTFIANFDQGITESDYSNNQFTLTFTVASPTPHQKLFVLIQGINTSISDTNAKANGGLGIIPDFYKSVRSGRGGSIVIPGIVPFLKSNGYSGAQFLSYSYKGGAWNGNPSAYPCLSTFTQHMSKDADLLGQQINAALTNNQVLKGKQTDIYLITHSLGGVVAYTYLTALLEKPTIVPTLPSNAFLKGVIALDAPLGGMSSNQNFEHIIFDKVFKEVRDKKGNVVNGCGGLTRFSQMTSVFDLAKLFDTTSKPTFPPPDDGKPNDNQGAHASTLSLLGGKQMTNQGLAEVAATNGTSILTIGNNNDFLYNPSACHLLYPPNVDFKTSQWIEDEAGADDSGDGNGIYSRQFTAGTGICEASIFFLVNHFEVFNNTKVENALVQFLAGNIPDALAAAQPNP